nr:gluconate:H+ symporter [Bacillus subtilis]
MVVVIASFIIGISLFFEVGLVLLIPIVFAISRELKISILFLGIPMVAALSVTHGFLPHTRDLLRSPVSMAQTLEKCCCMALLLLFRQCSSQASLFTKFAKKIVPASFAKNGNIASLGTQKTFNLEETPGFGISVFTAMLPIIIMSVATIIDLLQETIGFADNGVLAFIRLIGNASTAMIISLLVAVYTMGIKRNIPVKTVMDSCSTAISQIGMMLLIIGGGGAFKQVLINGGVGDYVADLFKETALSPIILAWLIAPILRISLGSATVAALSTTGLVIPLLGHSDVNLTLVVLATGAGSVIASHVNDAGFWMFKEYFGLSMKETFATWTLLETIISVAGLGFILLLSLVV